MNLTRSYWKNKASNSELYMKNKNNENFISCTQEFWSSYYGKDISEGEAHEIIQNTQEFFSILLRWQKRIEWETSNGKNVIDLNVIF